MHVACDLSLRRRDARSRHDRIAGWIEFRLPVARVRGLRQGFFCFPAHPEIDPLLNLWCGVALLLKVKCNPSIRSIS